jgi:hypothetical protein
MRSLLSRALSALLTLRWMLALALVEVGLRTSRLPRICRVLGLATDLRSGAASSGAVWRIPATRHRQARAVLRATQWWPFGDTCLRQCLLMGRMLRSEHPVLRIGVQRTADGVFAAHSWLEIDGRTLDPAAAEYALLHGGLPRTAP